MLREAARAAAGAGAEEVGVFAELRAGDAAEDAADRGEPGAVPVGAGEGAIAPAAAQRWHTQPTPGRRLQSAERPHWRHHFQSRPSRSPARGLATACHGKGRGGAT